MQSFLRVVAKRLDSTVTSGTVGCCCDHWLRDVLCWIYTVTAAASASMHGQGVLRGMYATYVIFVVCVLCTSPLMIRVVGVDSSAVAIALANKNVQRNHNTCTSPCDIRFVQQDVVAFLKQQLSEQSPLYDIVICDPPKLAPNRQSVAAAKKKYALSK